MNESQTIEIAETTFSIMQKVNADDGSMAHQDSVYGYLVQSLVGVLATLVGDDATTLYQRYILESGMSPREAYTMWIEDRAREVSEENDFTIHYGDVSAQDIYTSWDNAVESGQYWRKDFYNGREYGTAELFMFARISDTKITVDEDGSVVVSYEQASEFCDFNETVSARFYAVRA